MLIHFGVYFFLPYLVREYGISFGWYTKYLTGAVRNPAIASATAIVLSTVVGLTVYLFSKSKVSYGELQGNV